MYSLTTKTENFMYFLFLVYYSSFDIFLSFVDPVQRKSAMDSNNIIYIFSMLPGELDYNN